MAWVQVRGRLWSDVRSSGRHVDANMDVAVVAGMVENANTNTMGAV
jgi:hypothetical protein